MKNRHEGEPLTQLLHAWKRGEQAALDQLMPMVYQQLRRIAANRLRGERRGHSLDPTDLVHEAFAKVLRSDVEFDDRAHFFALLAGLMRRVLVDHARSRNAEKRGAGGFRVTLGEQMAVDEDPVQLLELDDALDRLAKFDARSAKALELHYFGGLSHAEVATVLEISKATASRDLRLALAWLAKELRASSGNAV